MRAHRMLALGIALASTWLGCGTGARKERASAEATSSGAEAAGASPSSSASSALAPVYPSGSASVDAVSGASMKPADGPTVVTTGSVDGGVLRKRHRDRIAKDTSAFTVLRGDTALDLGQRICEAVVPKRPADTPILLKPNICGFDAMQDAASHDGDDGVKGRITNPEFVRGVIRCLKARGHTKITVAEGCSLNHAGFEKLVKLAGYVDMTKAEGVPLVAMDDDGTYDQGPDAPGKPSR